MEENVMMIKEIVERDLRSGRTGYAANPTGGNRGLTAKEILELLRTSEFQDADDAWAIHRSCRGDLREGFHKFRLPAGIAPAIGKTDESLDARYGYVRTWRSDGEHTSISSVSLGPQMPT